MNPVTPDATPADAPPAPLPTPSLRHTVSAGLVASVFLRDGPVAAQLLLTGGSAPRLLVAFAAGNSGAAIWFHTDSGPVVWRLVSPPLAIEALDAQGRTLRGVEAVVEATVDAVDTVQIGSAPLRVKQALLGSLRVLRDHQFDGRLPALGLAAPQAVRDTVVWSRDRLDGAAGYALSLQVEGGRVETAGDAVALFAKPGSGPLRLKLRALTGDEALTPMNADDLLTGSAADLPSARFSLLFLSYREKLLAGSWRFHTYFGRDTLMALRLLMPVLRPAAIEAALASVLLRLSPAGEVAHEEDIGEFAVLTRLLRGEAASAQPIYDYKMVDDDFMLLPVVSAYLLDSPAGRERAAGFLAQGAAGGTAFGALLVRNAAWVLEQTQPFAQQPGAATLLRLKPGEIVGDWRDSGDGLGGGVYAYSTNAVLAGAALRALQALAESGLLAPYTAGPHEAAVNQAGAYAAIWEQHAPALFEVRCAAAQATHAVRRCAAELGVPAGPAEASLGAAGELVFSALSLNAAGQPVPVLHSDFSFALLLSDPPPAVLEREVHNLMRPFPAGLMTGVGLLVANAAYGGDALRPMFGADRYHGAVVWSWQQAMVAAGLERQLARTDLPGSTRARLRQAQSTLWQAITDSRAVADSELWSWAWHEGRYEVRPFGPVSATADESNAAQLWSTVYLAVKPPAPSVVAAPPAGPVG